MKSTVLFSLILAFSATLAACEVDTDGLPPYPPTAPSTPPYSPSHLTKQVDLKGDGNAILLDEIDLVVTFASCDDRASLVKSGLSAASLKEVSPSPKSFGQLTGEVPGACDGTAQKATLIYTWSRTPGKSDGLIPTVTINAGETVSLFFDLQVDDIVPASTLKVSGNYWWTDAVTGTRNAHLIE